jgi:glyoxylase-like metal-dependent hydrolase (beta-lactamase superfamily II)
MTRSWIAALLLLFPIMTNSQASAGMQRFQIGSVELTAIEDSQLALPTSVLQGATVNQLKAAYGAKTEAVTSVNAFVLRFHGHLILIDTGARTGNTPHLLEQLKSAGIDPASIEAVLLTHLHYDHIGNLLTPEGKRAFPNAAIRLSRAEYNYWLDPAQAATPARQQRLDSLKTLFAPYLAAGACKPFDKEEAPFPGITAIVTGGHTPGHTIYQIQDGPKKILFIGDTIHFDKVQFPSPEVTVSFDSDSSLARQNRLHLFEQAAQQGTILASAHIPFPGVGTLRKIGSGFQWQPLQADAPAK